MDSSTPNYSLHPNIAPRYPQNNIPQHGGHHHHHHLHQQPQPPPPSTSGSVYPSIDVDALAAGVQRFLPAGRPTSGYTHNSSYIHLPPGVDPATVDFRTFYPYNPSEVKHRKRTTRPQLKVLEETFKRETKPNAALRKQLAAQLEMTPRGVQVWFQNRRAKEKNLAKKASANGRKSINRDDGQNDDAGRNDADGDVDRDDGDGTVDDDSTKSNCERPSRPASQTPGTTPALDERKPSSLSSSNSPESTSPELTPPNGLNDAQPCVSVNTPGDDDGVSIQQVEAKHGVDPSGLSFPPTSWQGPQRSMSRTPTSGMAMEQGSDYGGDVGYAQDRRTSLPTVLGIGPSRVRAGYHSSPRINGVPLGGHHTGRMMGFDPTVRRMSLDRLASHPYAHVAAQANSVVYGSSLSRYRPTLPATTHSTPTLTPQARTTELPAISQTAMDGAQQGGNGSANGDINSNSGTAELSLPSHMQQSSVSPPAPEIRPELMHRQSLPPHIAIPGHFASSNAGYPPQPQSANPMSMRFPRQGHVYALSSRNYQPPIAGPLPNPDFSFGSVGNSESEGSPGESSGTPDLQFQSSLNKFQFPAMDDGKDNNGNSTNVPGSLDMEMESDPQSNMPGGGLDPQPAMYYRDPQGGRGVADPFASRFGSIASTVSITESESSVTSGACFSSEAGSNFDAAGYNDARRASCTGSMMEMFSNLDVHNNSQSSLPRPLDHQKQRDTHQPQVPISNSSELALAFLPEDDNKSSAYRGDNGSNVNVNYDGRSASTNDLGIYSRASLSSSDVSHGHGYGHRPGQGRGLGSRYPFAHSSRSATSSRSSLAMQRGSLRVDIDFIRSPEDVSETGHYSPVSHSPAPFEYPLSEPVQNGMGNHGNGSVPSLHGMGDQGSNGMMNRTPPHTHQYGVDTAQGQHQQQQSQSQYYSIPEHGGYGQPQHPPSQSASTYGVHSQENVSSYAYYS